MSLLSYVSELKWWQLRKVEADLELMLWPSVIPSEYQPLWWDGVNGVPDELTAQRVYGLIDVIKDHVHSVRREAKCALKAK